ncbi:MAG: hypothetical protein JO048_09695 [Methylobacteriaceae bacterium]|nr:hypothetical protein [Methylobacteriaceae bacterium]
MGLTRRSLTGAAALAATGAMGGCGTLFTPPVTTLCPESLPTTGPAGPLTIDTHVHMFNGSDIQIREYIAKVRSLDTPGLKDLAGILQILGDAVAPSGEAELTALRDLSARLASACSPGEAKIALSAYADVQHQRSVQALKSAASRMRGRRRLGSFRGSGETVADAIEALPDRYAPMAARRHRLRSARGSGRRDDGTKAAVDFVVHQLQYRFVNLIEFLNGYQVRSGRQIDLALCHMLDFDWALAGGSPTPTTIEEQIDVMEQVAILTGGRAHGYAPFDPFKQVAHALGLEPANPFDRLAAAVMQRGCIGVKMYPPMGFAPFGNAFIPPSFWVGSSVPRALQRPDLGVLLDQALGELYAWCVANAVPIMLHTSASNGPSIPFRETCTDPKNWARMPDDVARNLRVSFGHFGDTEVGRGSTTRAQAYAALMGKPGDRGGRYYADAAYFTHGLDNPATVRDALRALYELTATRDAPLAERLMYGSDWEMLLIEGGDTTAYLGNFVGIFQALDRQPTLRAETPLSDRFFGLNAARYLDLRSNTTNSTRGRLDRFYSAYGVPKPAWQVKVDRSAALGA